VIRFFYSIFILFTLSFLGCVGQKKIEWKDVIPNEALLIIIPDDNTTVEEALNLPFFPVLDDITSSTVQVIGEIDERLTSKSNLRAILLYPDTSTDLKPVWISILPENGTLVSEIKKKYQRPFVQNNYEFSGYTIEKLFTTTKTLYAVQLQNYFLLSESSLALENSIRALSDSSKRFRVSGSELQAKSIILNTPALDTWIQQLAKVEFRPFVMNAFEGTTPIDFKYNSGDDGGWTWQLKGDFQIESDEKPLVRSLSGVAREPLLDRYVPANAAAFYLYRFPTRKIPYPDEQTASAPNFLDSYLMQNTDVWKNLAESLGDETAFTAFAESGALSTSEFLFLRELSNRSRLAAVLDTLAANELITKDESTYFIQSEQAGLLFAGEMSSLQNFYLTIVNNDAIALARRKGLAESVEADVSRRRVIFYEDQYMDLRSDQPEKISSILYVDASKFAPYIAPWLKPQNRLGALLSGFDILSVTTTRNNEQGPAEVAVSAYQLETFDQPYREQWVFPIGGADLTGEPVFANLSGSSREEVIFATETGSVYVLAADGTIVTQTSTESDKPIGSPVIFDWYGNSQNVVMIAAGDKIYAWNDTGILLPNFPVNLGEEIITPLQVMDVTRNGVAEMIVATADRRLHILNSRGEAINGWPRTTNTPLTSTPLIEAFMNERTVFAVSENILHAWSINGQLKNGFPIFFESSLLKSPSMHADHLFLSGSDGNLYAMGMETIFADSLSETVQSDSIVVQSLKVSNSELNNTPTVYRPLMKDENDEFYREDLLLLQSRNGSLFLYNLKGELRFTKTLGQPSDNNYEPVITDINKDQRQNLVALAGFGRLYAWDILSGERLFDLPTSGMSYPVIFDITGDGNNELIANTRNGLRAWTIFRAEPG